MKNLCALSLGMLIIFLSYSCETKPKDPVSQADIESLKNEIEAYKKDQLVKDWMVLIDIAQAIRNRTQEIGAEDANSNEYKEALDAFTTLKKADSKMTNWAGDYDVNVLKPGSSPTNDYLKKMLKELKGIDQDIDDAVSKGKKYLDTNGLPIPDTFKAPEIDEDKEPDFRITRKVGNN